VTEARTRQLNAVKFEALPLESAIKIKRGNGLRKVAIFEDPNCGYCKRFERDLLGITDITVYVFLFPILSPDSVEKSKACGARPTGGRHGST
jgi:thiol:disulfide interchange protein DsbC